MKFKTLFCLKNSRETHCSRKEKDSPKEKGHGGKIPELGINSKHTMAVGDNEEFKGHGGSALHGVLVAAYRAEAAMAAERNKLEFAAVRVAVRDAGKGRASTVKHFINIFHFCIFGMGV